MKKFNISSWVLEHRSLFIYFMIIFFITGAKSYNNLGREEDPSFTIKIMAISAQWPGASIEDTLKQVTERIERKLEELDVLKNTRSLTKAGGTVVFVELKPNVKPSNVQNYWFKIRNMIGDIRHEFPPGVLDPVFNDQYGDVFGNIYAFTGDGLSERQLRDYVEVVRNDILRIKDIGKVEIIGARDEVIFLEFSSRKLALLGLDKQILISTIQKQNAVTPLSFMEIGPERIAIRVSGKFSSEESLRNINLNINNQFFRLTDIAQISRGYTDPPSSLFRFGGRPAIALAISAKAGANQIVLGKIIKDSMRKIEESKLPIGVNFHLIANQSQVIEDADAKFTRSLFEAVIIVLIISFFSLGLRAGLVVAFSIPLTLSITFVIMDYFGITLQRISLGALIIALGLLVDDAMIAVEMMIARMEAGDKLHKAVAHMYNSTAFSMLTGTLVTVAGFIPISFNDSAAGEFTFSLFFVLAVSLLLSWAVAVVFTPLLGVIFLPETIKNHHRNKTFFHIIFSRIVELSIRHCYLTIGVTIVIFLGSLFCFQFVQNQFFPATERKELIIDWTLPQNSSISETEKQISRLEHEKLEGNPDIEIYYSYIGRGGVRFVLSFDTKFNSSYVGQTIIIPKTLEARDRLKRELDNYLKKDFFSSDVFVKLLDVGPPSGRPIVYRISGENVDLLRKLARNLSNIISRNPHIGKVVYDWMEPERVVEVDILQDKARLLNITSSDVSDAINNITTGKIITKVSDDIYLIDVNVRSVKSERITLDTLKDLQLSTPTGEPVALGSIANIKYGVEPISIWRRNRIPTISISAGVIDSTLPDTILKQIGEEVKTFQNKLPSGFTLEVGGVGESSKESQEPIIRVVPWMLIIMVTILMIQLESFSQLFLVFSVAPLAIIGVVIALLLFGKPLGFVAILGILALIGILIRNSVILVVQIEKLRSQGVNPWVAVREAVEHRVRPIFLTAAAASLGLLPITRDIFWMPMAYAMIGGIISGTLLTLTFFPALYVVLFRIKPFDQNDELTK
ncbi:RND efflux transporter [Liberibacter crescens BT-1]|uniref:RND efflux transporter n=1 Tax=Liberibacter crescens (strain BT-1) TaxID=1215343 RepID=L0EUV3_LIBCB|nr:efflux RND transporter permease subunit [Liberibacter crescens]AGA65329.1 RND efflux transporter [Liberibacter crescens BT-1]AMC13258.1 ACR family transporter [Liberibacter crescens]